MYQEQSEVWRIIKLKIHITEFRSDYLSVSYLLQPIIDATIQESTAAPAFFPAHCAARGSLLSILYK